MQAPSEDPATRLEQAYREVLGILPGEVGAVPSVSLVAIAGDIDPSAALAAVERHFADVMTAPVPAQAPLSLSGADLRVAIAAHRAQAQIGYAVPAPLPTEPGYLAWRALQYILAHDYEGRLGREAIARQGLAYFIDSQYRSDGRRAWISIGAGVDPSRLPALEAAFRAELAGLATSPPSEEEVAEARGHFAGRLATQRQSNEELTEGLAQDWLWYGSLRAPAERLEAIRALRRDEVLAAVEAFRSGRFVVVEVGKTPSL